MSRKTVIILGLIIIAAAAIYTYKKSPKEAKAPSGENQISSSQQKNNPSQTAPTSSASSSASGSKITPAKTGGGIFSAGESNDAGPGIQVYEVDYEAAGFTPNPINIKVNDYVFFKNKSTLDFWPASNPHPVHTDYPGFDAKQPIAPGGEYKFQFTRIGNWGYHNHLNPSQGGTVKVAQ